MKFRFSCVHILPVPPAFVTCLSGVQNSTGEGNHSFASPSSWFSLSHSSPVKLDDSIKYSHISGSRDVVHTVDVYVIMTESLCHVTMNERTKHGPLIHLYT